MSTLQDKKVIGTGQASPLWQFVCSLVIITTLPAVSGDRVLGDVGTLDEMLVRLSSPLPQSGWEPGVRNFLEVGRHYIIEAGPACLRFRSPCGPESKLGSTETAIPGDIWSSREADSETSGCNSAAREHGRKSGRGKRHPPQAF